jgi:predicted enzyme involved in methoxymalonyl-ACP biosynthesis
MMSKTTLWTFYIRFRDRFTGRGLIAVAISRKENTDFHIDTLLMSCRVKVRTVENCIIDQITKQMHRNWLLCLTWVVCSNYKELNLKIGSHFIDFRLLK